MKERRLENKNKKQEWTREQISKKQKRKREKK